MKKRLIAILLIGLTTISIAETIDLDKKEGTDQEVIVSLDPTPASITVDENHTLQATFKIELQPKPISMQEVKLTKLEEEPKSSGIGSMFHNRNSKNKTINGKISYSTDKKSILFKADNPLGIGYYEIEFRRLIPRFNPTTMPMDYKRIKTIKYRFYVPEVINGYMLPPEPDKEKNDATVLGIDRNENDVRDDVERKILKTYNEPIKVELILSDAKTHQKMLQDPVDLAIESQKKMSRVGDCALYLKHKGIRIKNWVKNNENLIYNTKKRIKAYLEFNKALSGGSYGSGPADWTAEACDFDVDTMLKDMK